MSTRGAYGFRKDGVDKITYNHCDSDPGYVNREKNAYGGLGLTFLTFAGTHPTTEMVRLFNHIKMVRETAIAPEADRDKIALVVDPAKDPMYQINFANTPNSEESKQWYWVLHRFQGVPERLMYMYHMTDTAYMTDAGSFIKNSLFCEYAYIINLDDNVFEVWNGFQIMPDSENRYGQRKYDGYYPCSKVAEFNISRIQSNINKADTDEKLAEYMEKMLDKMIRACDRDRAANEEYRKNIS